MNSYIFNVLLTEDEIEYLKTRNIINPKHTISWNVHNRKMKDDCLLVDIWEQIDPQYASKKLREEKDE